MSPRLPYFLVPSSATRREGLKTPFYIDSKEQNQQNMSFKTIYKDSRILYLY
jgi:hypothetical protein